MNGSSLTCAVTKCTSVSGHGSDDVPLRHRSISDFSVALDTATKTSTEIKYVLIGDSVDYRPNLVEVPKAAFCPPQQPLVWNECRKRIVGGCTNVAPEERLDTAWHTAFCRFYDSWCILVERRWSVLPF